MALRDFLQQGAGRSALVFFLLLFCGDIAFVALHFVNFFIFDSPGSIYSIEQDRGVSEFYQYIKYIWIIGLLFSLSLTNRTWCYISWILVFTYFFLDDSLEIHETLGWQFASGFVFEPFLGLRLQDFGELMVTALAGGALLIPLLLTFWKGNMEYRKFSQDVFILVLTLVFFGVGVDMAHIMFSRIDWSLTFLLGVIEDGGEMLSVSLILSYVYYQFLKKEQNNFYICDYIRRYLAKS